MIDLPSYHRDGFAVIRTPEIAKLRVQLADELAACALGVMAKEPAFARDATELRGHPVGEIVDHVVAHETANTVSGVLYRIFSASPAVMASVSTPVILSWLKELGIAVPVASTTPTVRIDRPGDGWHRTDAHQDWWFSLLSPNSVTVWIPIRQLTADMGFLEAAAGSHRAGEVLFRDNVKSNNPFRPAEDWPDEAFKPVPLESDEALLFSQFLVHRSGFNRSQHTRLSLQLRYNDIATMRHVDSSFAVKHSDYVLKEQARRLVKT